MHCIIILYTVYVCWQNETEHINSQGECMEDMQIAKKNYELQGQSSIVLALMFRTTVGRHLKSRIRLQSADLGLIIRSPNYRMFQTSSVCTT